MKGITGKGKTQLLQCTVERRRKIKAQKSQTKVIRQLGNISTYTLFKNDM